MFLRQAVTKMHRAETKRQCLEAVFINEALGMRHQKMEGTRGTYPNVCYNFVSTWCKRLLKAWLMEANREPIRRSPDMIITGDWSTRTRPCDWRDHHWSVKMVNATYAALANTIAFSGISQIAKPDAVTPEAAYTVVMSRLTETPQGIPAGEYAST